MNVICEIRKTDPFCWPVPRQYHDRPKQCIIRQFRNGDMAKMAENGDFRA